MRRRRQHIDPITAIDPETQLVYDRLGYFGQLKTMETTASGAEDSPGAEPRTVTVTSATVISDPVLSSSVIEEGDDKVGYVVFNTFGTSTAERRLFETFTDLAEADVDDLVLDLRYNGGGFLDIASQLGYMIAGDKSEGQTFETLQFNDKFPTRNPVTNELIRPTPFFSETLGFSLNAGTLEMSYRETMIRDTPPSIIGQGAN